MPKVYADTSTLTTSADFNLGEFTNTESTTQEGTIKLNASGTWNSRVWKTPDLPLYDGSVVATDSNYAYLIPGRDTEFLKYIPSEDKWIALANAPHMTNSGADMVVVGNYIYVEFGGYQNEFSRYSIADNTWTDMSSAPDLFYSGGSLSTDGTNVYALHGAYTTDFWKYTVATGTWTVMTGTPASVYAGADLVYYNGAFYTPRGYNTLTMYKYDMTSGSWSTLANAPQNLYDDGNITIKGDNIYVMRGYSFTDFFKYNITTNTWSSVAAIPSTSRFVGALYISSVDKMYVFRGNNTYDWWQYNPGTDSFAGSTDLPANPGSGADLVYYNGDIYYLRGNNSTNFYKFNVSSGAWTTLAVAPATINDDTKGVRAGSYLYYYRAGNTNTFYRYDPVANTWSTLAVTPANATYGSSLTYPGSGDYIYGTRGAFTGNFWRYSISTNTWDDTGAADLPSGYNEGYGSRIISDGTDVYAITGYLENTLLKYTVATNTWSVLGSIPFAPFWGTDIVYDNGKIFAQSGFYHTGLWEYTVATSTWRRLPDMSGTYASNIGPYNGGSLAADTTNHVLYSISGQNIYRMLTFTPASTNYPTSGTWVSGVMDLTYVSSWTSFSDSITTPGDSAITFQTRTSDDKITWSSWQSVTGGVIASSTARYIEVKATLNSTTDQTQTPVLSSVSINYSGDTTAPTNPSSFTGSSQAVGGILLTSGNSYSYAHPYFTWGAGSDGQSGLSGYYVYFGTNASADPQIDGSFQTAVTYTVNTPLSSGTYYLRVSTKDIAGNVSASVTGFTYTYAGVSPPQSVVQNSTSDFLGGTATNVSTTNNKITLGSKAGFWQQTRITPPPLGVYYGAGFGYVKSAGMLYTFRGYNTTTFYSYNTGTDTWTTLATAPSAVYQGGDLVEGPSGYLYGIPGQNTNKFWRYDIANNVWSDTDAADAPGPFYYGSSLVYDGSRYIYALKGGNDDAFYRYDTQTDSWDSLANIDFGAPSQQFTNYVYVGGDMAYDGSDTLYAIQGNTYSGFSSYSITGNSWTTLPNLPVLPYDGAQISYDATSNAIYYISGWSNPFLYKFDLSTQTWSKLPDAPIALSGGSAMRNVNGTLYVLRGQGTNSFWEYNIAKGSWQTPTVALFGPEFRGSNYRPFGLGAQIVKGDSDNYYLTRGNYDNMFVRYNATTGVSTTLADVPGGFYVGSSMAYDSVNNVIYAVPSQYIQKIYAYDISTDTWTVQTSDPPPFASAYGSSMTYDGSRYIYWGQGGNTTGFYRYDTQRAAGSRWSSALAAPPAGMHYGSKLQYKDGYVYTLRGGNVANNPFYRYDPSTNLWSTMSPLSVPVYQDGFLVDGGTDTLYACRAYNNAGCYKYTISTNTWSSIADAPANIYQGGGAAGNGSDRMFVIAGNAGVNTYNNGLYSYIFQTDTSSFEESGNYISAPLDLTATYKYANVSVTYTSASNTSLTVYTRSSSDASTWSSWVQADDPQIIGTTYSYGVNSPVNRYIEVKFAMTSGDGIKSGTISSFSVNYYQDTAAPSNPTLLSPYTTSTQSATLTTNTWGNYSAPYFSWPAAEATGGASDTSTGSGVAGYYVYFGTNSTADPQTDGTLQTSTNYTAGGLTSGDTYYLRIKTVDDAGNISSATWAPFIYKFDNVEPTNPSTVVADPSGYSATDSFDFSWSGATDSASGINDYCYKTGATGATETCGITAASVSAILSYKTGTNTFYVRAEDVAGNKASSYVNASYYYSSTAPGAPQNLTVTPSNNTVNSFAFAWQPPIIYYGAQSSLRYYYSVNALPTAQNVNQVGLVNAYLTADSYATVPGANTFYVVAKDEAGNIDYNNYASVTFTADTSAPGIPQNVDIADISVKSLSSWKLALSWEAPAATGSGVSTYKVYTSTASSADCTSDFSNFSYAASTTGKSFVDSDLTQVNHYYCVKACDSTNNCSAVSDTVSMLPTGKWTTAADLTASPSATIKTKTAIISWSTSRGSNSFIKYGKSSGDYGDEVGSSEQVTAHTITLTGLDPGTTYYYQASWTDEDGNVGKSDEYSFTTNPAPIVSGVKMENVSINSAFVTFTVENATSVSIQYGPTVQYGGAQTLQTSKDKSTNTVILDGLKEGTQYHLQVVAKDEEGNTFAGDDYIFQTLPVPKITQAVVQQVIGEPTATLRILWSSNTPISSVVSYYPTNNPSAARDQVNLALTKTHQVILSSLADNTDYSIQIKGKDSAGNQASYPAKLVKTSADLRPPSINNLSVESTIVGVGQDAKAQVVVSWDTDEPSTTQVQYAEGTGASYGQTTQLDTNLTFNHVVTISGLTPSKIYHLQALSRDKAGNSGASFDTVIVTPKSTKAALNIVIDNLSKTFGFLNNTSLGK